MKIKTSLPVTRVKRFSVVESSELTPIEKFKEVQKQDWQIEALIIGSIILGLTQVPDLMNRYYLDFADIFGVKAIGIEMMLNIPFALLLITLLIVLFIRAIWIIEAFGSRNIKRMNELNEMAGAYFGSGILYFLIVLSGALFWSLFNFLFSTPTLLFLLNTILFSGTSFFILMIRLFPSEMGFRKKVNTILVSCLIIISPFSFGFVIRSRWMKISYELFFKFQEKFGKKVKLFEYTFLILSFIYFNYLLFFTGFFESSNHPISVTAKNSPIIIEDERFSNETLWLFVHASAIDKIRKKTQFYFGEEQIIEQKKYKIHRTLPNDRKLQLFINGRYKNYKWCLNYQDVGLGLKTYLRASEMKRGFNEIRIKTFREGRWTLWDFSLYKP
jgi:hypothetical protein